ncbi:MAG: PAS domain S-box protein [Chloroflexi bacterium]|nr:PAS domain S-box protein [Chloroflexota bacterium]
MTAVSSTIYLVPIIAACGLLFTIVILGFMHPRVTGAKATAVLALSVSLWQVGYLLELISPDLPQKVFWDKVQWIPILLMSLAAFKLGLIFNTPHSRIWLLPLTIPPLLFCLRLFMDSEQSLIYPAPMLLENPPFSALFYDFTPLLAAALAYVYLLVGGALLLLARAFFRTRRRERIRIGFIFGGLALGAALHLILTTFEVPLLGQRDVSPLACTPGALVIAWGVWRYRLFDLIPVANGKLFESMSDAVVILDADSRIIELNAVARSWAKTSVQPIGQPVETVIPDWKAKFDRYRNAVNVETEIRITDYGASRFINFRIEPIRNARGDLVGRLVVARDITQSAMLLERLRQNEERLRIITDNIHDMVAQIDQSGIILYASPSFYKGLGYKPDRLVGRVGFDLIYPEDIPQMREWFEAFIVHGTPRSYITFRCQHADGHLVWLEASGTMAYDRAGQAGGIIAIFRDVSERIELERAQLEQERLKVTLQKEKELSELKNRMMVRIGHEFRTPLAVIQTSSYLLENYLESYTAEQRRAKIQLIHDEIQQISAMLDAISDVVANRLTRQSLQLEPVSLEALCALTVDAIRTTNGAKRAVTLETHGSPTVFGDYAALQSAVNHVLKNAVQYSRNGNSVQVTLSEQEGEAIIQVRDEGIGIPADEQHRVFEPFFRGTNIGESGGLGLGLTIAQAAVIAHHGRIMVESDVNQGTTFTIRLPALSGKQTPIPHP